jgi:transposase
MGQKMISLKTKLNYTRMQKTTTKFYLGIDVSKSWFDISMIEVINHQKQPMQTERFNNTADGIKLCHQWLKKQKVGFNKNSLVVIENTGVYHRLIWSFCSKYNLPLYIGNAAHIKWSLGITRGKNDIVDSQRLCAYGCKEADDLKVAPALDIIFMQLKDLMTARTKLLSQLRSTQVYIKELKLSNDASVQKVLEKAHKAALEGLKKSIQLIEAEMQSIIGNHDAIKTNYDLLLSVPGIGSFTAIYLICCTNNFNGKISGKQLASYAGVVPFGHTSGSSIKGKNKVHKMANKDLKKLLHLCALTTIKYYPEFKDYYERKKAEGKHAMSILNAIRNKIVLRAVAVVNKKTLYVNNYVKAA